jgi:hypothetical protein
VAVKLRGISLSALLLGLLTALPVQAQLSFEKTNLEIEAKASDMKAEAVFPFKNTGSEIITIREVKPSCDCTAARLEKRTYRPGESGTITAVFTFGDRVGMQFKQVVVKTDEEPKGVYPLSFQVRILAPLTVSPLAVFWSRGEAASPQVLRIVASDSVEKLEVKPRSGKVKTELRETTEGRVYELMVTPQSTDETFRETIVVEAQIAGTGKTTVTCYAYVK